MKKDSEFKEFIIKTIKCAALAVVIGTVAISAVGCKKSADENSTDAVQNAPATYGQTDFAIYTVDDENMPSKFLTMLGVDENTIEYTDESAQYMSQFIETQTVDQIVADEENPGQNTTEKQVRYIYFKGSHDPVINVKGIRTTGIVADDEKCSTVQDVVDAYDIDTESENYIETKREDGSYVIRLNFTDADAEGNIERIVAKPEDNLNVTEGKYAIRFDIINDHVHGIEYYMYY